MALISCPACYQQISERVPRCPNCGHPMAAVRREAPPHVAAQPNSGAGVVVVFVLLLVVFLGGAFALFQTDAGKRLLHGGPQDTVGGPQGTSRGPWDRATPKPGPSKERTFAYWDGIRSLYFTTALANASDKKMDFGRAAISLRQVASRMDEMPTSEVDPEAIECCREMSDLCIKAAALFDRLPSGAGGTATTLRLLLDMKAALAEAAAESKALREQADKAEAKVRRTRTALSQRYGVAFPRLTPPVAVFLQSFLVSTGYYVYVQNPSSSDPVNVQVTYTATNGQSRTQNAGTVRPASFVKLDPSDVGWTIAANQKIRIDTDGYSYTYDTNALIPK